MKYIFRPSAEKKFAKLAPKIQKRIVEKLEYFISTPNPLNFAEPLTNYEVGQYRFRIGSYRVIFDLENQYIVILNVGHRRDIYR